MHPLIPLLIVIIVLLVGAVVGFVIYTIATDIASKTSKKMEDKNISFGKEGMKVGVKEIRHEDYVGNTQDVLVKAWNLSTWPAYKSRFWNKQKAPSEASPSTSRGKSGSGSYFSGSSGSGSSSSTHKRQPSPYRPSSSSSGVNGGASSHHSKHRTENGRLAEPRPAIRRSASGSSIPGSFD